MIDILQIKSSAEKLEPISLKEMDSVKLMNRTDTKFVFHINQLPEILEKSKTNYRILSIENNRTPSYKTLYFETPKHRLFLDHHNERGNRFKIRIRNYIESKLFYLEIKKKIKGRTDKHRIKLSGFEENLSPNSIDFIYKKINEELILQPFIWNSFQRMTLVNKNVPERITIDFNLSFDGNGKSISLDHLIIAEVKQEKVNLHNPFISLLKSYGIRENSVSKYCIGSLLCFPELKYNNFKPKLRLIEKLKTAA